MEYYGNFWVPHFEDINEKAIREDISKKNDRGLERED